MWSRQASANDDEVPIVSLDKTRALINECLDQFLEYQLRASGSNDVNGGKDAIDDNQTLGLAEAHQQQSTTPVVEQRSGVVPRGSNVDRAPSRQLRIDHELKIDEHRIRPSLSFKKRSLPLSGTSDKGNVQAMQDSRKYIFLNLETYIISCFNGVDCLNTSFMTYRPSQPLRAASEGTGTRQAANPKSEDLCEENGVFPDLDAKTLLLGDFAENGIWWAGVSIASIHLPICCCSKFSRVQSCSMFPLKIVEVTCKRICVESDPVTSCKRFGYNVNVRVCQESPPVDSHRPSTARKPSVGHSDGVNSKSPRIDWNQVQEWYELIASLRQHSHARMKEEVNRMKTQSFAPASHELRLLDDCIVSLLVSSSKLDQSCIIRKIQRAGTGTSAGAARRSRT